MTESRLNTGDRIRQRLAIFLLIACLLALPAAVLAKNVVIETPLGDIEIELLEEDAPKTVANFLRYIENESYVKSFIHRSVPGFIIQGGGFYFEGDGAYGSITTFEPVENEFNVSNTRGTVAMAKLGGQPDSATSQWFINVDDNSANLDGQNGGFTVFARVVGDGMDIVDAINQLPRVNAGGPLTELPVIDFVPDKGFVEEILVITTVSEKDGQAPFAMNAGLNDAWYNPLTNGQGFFITVFPELGLVSLAWFTYDTVLPGEGDTANLGDPGHRWLTALGAIEGNMAVMNIDITSGGLFDTATDITRTDPAGSDGTITLSFDGCGSGLVEYDITSIDQQGSVPIKRVADDNVALCEALASQ
jgi:cyclophilin family peptidyl-prolyl cis-trans isomerase